MQIIKYLIIALFGVFTVLAQGSNGTNATIFELLTSKNATYKTSRFINLLNSDNGYQPIVQLLSERTRNLTVFVPDDAAFGKIFDDYRKYNSVHRIKTKREYPPANWTYHSLSILNILQYHMVNNSFLLTNLTKGNVSVVYSLLNDRTVNRLPNLSLPLLIQANTTFENATNQTWLAKNAKYLKFNVGNGVDSSTVVLRDLKATNGHFNIINSVLIPPLKPSRVIPKVKNVSYLAPLLRKYPKLTSALNDATNFTIFAPTNEAFKRLNIHKMSNNRLRRLALSHVVKGVYYSTNFTQNANSTNGRWNLTTFNNNSKLSVSVVNGSLIYLNNTAKIVRSNIFFNNGVMHIIDRALNITA
ncbi:hypothetical protein G6F37_002078 [Rhizopus arrhizus]|nr:hypothetical protein G6F38_005518 [Rhizopus arrhizus]KAG1162529.1 hypothetical protein G6F37_002078 [Rhizopus arrhizus]